MPEILTKHPEIVLEILQKEGISCSRGAQQEILKTCPQENFCSLKTGELCVYGIEDFHKMTQIKKEDLCIPEKNHSPVVGYTFSFFAGFFVAFLFFRKRHKANY